jgi:ABC-type lipoprotein export system ATPase subunit
MIPLPLSTTFTKAINVVTELSDIKHSFNGSKTIVFPALSLREGERLLITGNSGSGKTTLLHIAAGLLKPTQGSVRFQNEDLYALKEEKIDRIRGKNFGIIFQKNHLLKNLNVSENLLAAMYFAGNKPDKNKALELLKSLGLEEEAEKMPYMLSEGQAQRASVARAVINDPKIIFADEPTSGLDDKNADAVANLLLASTQRLNAALLVSSHDLRLKKHFTNICEIGGLGV